MSDNHEMALVARGSTALSSVQMAELDVQVTTAKAYPRDVAACVTDMKAYVEALGPETAEDLYYVLPGRKNKDGSAGEPIEGPSVRMAEICASAWGNLRLQAHIVATNERDVVAESVCWDLEKNTAISVQKVRPIWGKYGRYSDDMIAKTALAAQSIALRDAVFRILPRPIIDSLVTRAKQLAGSSGEVEKRRKSLLAYFKGLGVDEETVLRYLECATTEEITPAQLVTMRGIATAIKEGQTTADDVFHPQSEPAGTEKSAMDRAAARLLSQLEQEGQPLGLVGDRLSAVVSKKFEKPMADMGPMELARVLTWVRDLRPEEAEKLEPLTVQEPAKGNGKRKASEPAEGNLV